MVSIDQSRKLQTSMFERLNQAELRRWHCIMLQLYLQENLNVADCCEERAVLLLERQETFPLLMTWRARGRFRPLLDRDVANPMLCIAGGDLTRKLLAG